MGRVINIPAPVGGINARDSYAAMPITDAISLCDLIPGTNYCESAPPCGIYTSAPTGSCRSLMPYEGITKASLLAAFGSGSSWDIVDITDPNSPTTLESAQTSGTYIYTMFQNKLIMCNGENTPQVYDGSTTADLVATGVTMSTLRGVITFKGRAYYWQKSTSSFYYAAAGAFQGALTAFPVDVLTTKGGKIMLLTAFTRDGGEGADDLFVIVMNTGEVLVYQGDDPASAAAWELVGKFMMPKPIGARSVLRIGGNTLLLTYEGVVDLGRVLAGQPYPLVSDKVRKMMTFQPTVAAPYADLISLLDFTESGSVLCNDMWRSDAQKWAPENGLMGITKAAGAWWTYTGNSTADFDFQYLSCSCVWQGKTYFGFDSGGTLPIFTPLAENGFYFDEVIGGGWGTLGNHGYAFAVSSGGTLLKNYDSVGTSNGEIGFSAYVTPFGGLLGNATMLQTIIGTIAGFWTGRDKHRWVSSNLRVKDGGKR